MLGGCEPSVDPQKETSRVCNLRGRKVTFGAVLLPDMRYATTDLWSGILDMTRVHVGECPMETPSLYETYRGIRNPRCDI